MADKTTEALQGLDWSDGSADTASSTASMVFSVRLKDDLADWVASEADRRHVSPSEVIRDAVATSRSAAANDQPITVTRGDLHRLIDKFPAA